MNKSYKSIKKWLYLLNREAFELNKLVSKK